MLVTRSESLRIDESFNLHLKIIGHFLALALPAEVKCVKISDESYKLTILWAFVFNNYNILKSLINSQTMI